MKVIFCCGETLEEREAEKQNEVVKAELEGSVFNLSAEEWKSIILAYEPIWAIGTGKTATSDQAQELFAKPDIDGGLIGGASLKAADFKGIIDAWKK